MTDAIIIKTNYCYFFLLAYKFVKKMDEKSSLSSAICIAFIMLID